MHGDDDDHAHDEPEAPGERAARLAAAIEQVLREHAGALAALHAAHIHPAAPAPLPPPEAEVPATRNLPELLSADEVRAVHEALGTAERCDLLAVEPALRAVDRFLERDGLDLFGNADLFETAARLLPAIGRSGACGGSTPRAALAAALVLCRMNGFVVEPPSPGALADLAARSITDQLEPLLVQDELRRWGRAV